MDDRLETPYSVWRIDGQKRHLNGRFSTKEEAENAKEKVVRHHGTDTKVAIDFDGPQAEQPEAPKPKSKKKPEPAQA